MATNKTVTVTVLPTLTGDTVASYNVYEGVSGTTLLGTMSVAEAAAGKVFAFTDGIVHSVKTQTVWTTAGASAIRSVGVALDLSSTSIIMQDDFTGTIDPFITDSKWTVVNADYGSGLNVSKNNALLISTDGTETIAADGSNSVTSIAGIDTNAVAIFDLNVSNGISTGSYWRTILGTTFPTVDGLFISKPSETGSKVNFRVYSDSVALKNTHSNIDLSTVKTIKLSYLSGVSYAHYWDGGWILLDSHAGVLNVTTGFKAEFTCGSSLSQANTMTIDNFYLLSEDIDTQYPV